MPKVLELTVGNLEETEAFGGRLGRHLFAGAVVGLIGPLGAGKTHLVRAIAEGLGVQNSLVVTSPTFVLIQEYAARLPIFHFDVYRLTSVAQFVDLGVHECYEAGGVCLIEWADRVREVLPIERLEIEISPLDANARRLRLCASGGGYEEVVAKLST